MVVTGIDNLLIFLMWIWNKLIISKQDFCWYIWIHLIRCLGPELLASLIVWNAFVIWIHHDVLSKIEQIFVSFELLFISLETKFLKLSLLLILVFSLFNYEENKTRKWLLSILIQVNILTLFFEWLIYNNGQNIWSKL